MPKSRKSLKKPRSKAYSRQNGRCYYCDHPMWETNPEVFADKYNITVRQAMGFRCTGEHLVPYQDGGDSGQENIVAACWFCNNKRHNRKVVPNPNQYQRFVQQRLDRGRWHNCRLAK